MNRLQQIQLQQVTEYPYTRDLYPYAVRITCSDSSDLSESLGSGILFNSKNVFKVLTARHCLYKKDGSQFPIEGIVIDFAEDKSRTFKAIDIIENDADKDLAILKVDFVPMSYQKPLYINSPLFVGEPFAKEIKTYGYSKSYRNGTSIKFEYVSPQTYRSLEGILAAGRDLEMIKGFSGSGIFTKCGSQIICEGFIKSKFDSNETLEEVLVGPIPNIGEDVWVERFDPAMSQGPLSSGNNRAKIEYLEAWRNLLEKIKSGNDCSEELQQVIEKRNEYRLSRSDSYQEQTIWYLFSKKVHWSNSEQSAFILALTDLGQWPALYGELPDKTGNIEQNPLCLRLLRRAATLMDDETIDPGPLELDTDQDTYEAILRSLYKFEFASAISLCSQWNPVSDVFFSKKLMMCHLLDIKDDNLTHKVEELIKEKPFGLENAFIDTVIANQCDFQIPAKYSYDEFNRSGLDSPGEVLSSILSKIDTAEKKVSVYGVHTTETLNNSDSSSFSAALRVINYIIESGIPTSEGFVWNISTYNWFKVFRHLFRNYPYPIVFYTLLYRDEKLLRRTGQEMAFTDNVEFRQKLPDILKRLLIALIKDETPNIMISSIFQMIGELFCSIDSDIWFLDFSNVILHYFQNSELQSLSHRDEFYKFMEQGITSIRTDVQRQELFFAMCPYINGNPLLISRLLSHVVYFGEKFKPEDRFKNIITEIINNLSFKQTLPLLAQLSFSNRLTETQLRLLNQNIKSEGIIFANGDQEALHYLSFIVNDKWTVQELKRIILQLNIWDCGIAENGISYHSVDTFPIGCLSSKIEWTYDEEALILENLNSNLFLIEKLENKDRFHGFLKNSVGDLLSRMYSFVTNEKIYTNHDVFQLKQRIETQIKEWSDSESLLERLVSEDYRTLSGGIDEVISMVKKYGIIEQKEAVQLLIDRALTKNKTALFKILSAIYYMSQIWSDAMNESFGKHLLILLKAYCDYDYESLELHAAHVNQILISLAKVLKNYYPDNSAIRHWTSDEVQNRFWI